MPDPRERLRGLRALPVVGPGAAGLEAGLGCRRRGADSGQAGLGDVGYSTRSFSSLGDSVVLAPVSSTALPGHAVDRLLAHARRLLASL
jgi:hypothetical protein